KLALRLTAYDHPRHDVNSAKRQFSLLLVQGRGDSEKSAKKLESIGKRAIRFVGMLPLKLDSWRGERFEATSDHPSRHGLLLRGNRGPRPTFIARQTGWRRRRPRPAWCFDDVQLRSAQVRCALGHADVHGLATLPDFDRIADAVRCLPARRCHHPLNPAPLLDVD